MASVAVAATDAPGAAVARSSPSTSNWLAGAFIPVGAFSTRASHSELGARTPAATYLGQTLFDVRCGSAPSSETFSSCVRGEYVSPSKVGFQASVSPSAAPASYACQELEPAEAS
eukprot:scaffold146125_cov30-Tisochrysis_lutea.AAC.2